MKIQRAIILAVVTACLLFGIALQFVVTRQAKQKPATNVAQLNLPEATREESPRMPSSPPESSQPPPLPLARPSAEEDASTSSALPTKREPLQSGANASPSAKAVSGTAKKPVTDPVARVALAFVGADPEAEAYWYGAINDPSLPPSERQDLIEDLNEDGISDPKHPSPDDLPLIISRILLIDQVRSQALDAVNADAFQEAYKDLLNLADVALGGGEPVR